jgi:hypothetical protein
MFCLESILERQFDLAPAANRGNQGMFGVANCLMLIATQPIQAWVSLRMVIAEAAITKMGKHSTAFPRMAACGAV